MKRMEILRIVLKVFMWILIIGFACNFIMQMISYSFYKNAKKVSDVSCTPEYIQVSDTLTGYGHNLDKNTNRVILFFGGSNDIAYNSVGKYADKFDDPFICVDYYGTQDSKGKMNLSSMQQSAVDIYEWVHKNYAEKEIVIIGHSYGSGMAAYLASVRECKLLVLAAGYRDVSDLYNKIIPMFWGPLKVFISNNMMVSQYAKNIGCPVYIISSDADTTLPLSIQEKLIKHFNKSTLKVFQNIKHEDYFNTEDVTQYVNEIINMK